MARWLAASDLDRACPDMASCKAQVLAIHGPPCSAVGGGDFPASASSALGVGGRCAGAGVWRAGVKTLSLPWTKTSNGDACGRR